MMRILKNPPKGDWAEICARPVADIRDMVPAVQSILDTVRNQGDAALRDFTARFDRVQLQQLSCAVDAGVSIAPDLAAAIRMARQNIETFHRSQVSPEAKVETQPGVSCWRRSLPIPSVGLYIPGGSAPLFSSLLMLGVPARLAGCREIVVCTPPQKDGSLHPAIAYTASLLGIERIYLIGGAQAIAAMAYGTESVPRVNKIFGPGNQYVTVAKQLVQTEGLAIDMPAGPSEVLVVADDSCEPAFVAADLLSQAEHGPDSQVMLFTDSEKVVAAVMDALKEQLAQLPRKAIAVRALENSTAVVLESMEAAMALSNQYAPEHLILASSRADVLAGKVEVAGSVFLGNYSCESAGDYASGTNHTLPTNGFARSYSGVSLDSFVNKVTFQQLSPTGLQNIGPAIELMAEAEALDAHKRAVSIRLKQLRNV